MNPDIDRDQLSFDSLGGSEERAAAPNETPREPGPEPAETPAPSETAPSETAPSESPAPSEPPAPLPEPPPPTPEQAEAIGNRDRDVFLEAGAGTGKTRVLVARYCEAVDADQIDPERILAFTFTERAAGEMRRRLRAELTRRAAVAAAAGDGQRRSRLLAASRLGGGATISTIHGFCRRLLATHPVAAGLDPRFRVLGAEEAARVGAAAFDRAVTELSRTDDGIALAAAGYRGPRLARAVKGAFFGLRSKGVVPPVLPALPAIEELAVDGNGDGTTTPAEAQALQQGYDALGKLLSAFAESYEGLKAERSAVDFDDLQLIALRLLRENEAIATTQRERFDHVLVDEFQDTDPVQLELIHLLTRGSAKLFTVGDEAQSIYGFRGADLEGFRRERARAREAGGGEGGTKALALTGSFRSTPEVVAAVNVVGDALVEDYRHLRVGKPASASDSGVTSEAGGARPGEPRVEVLVTESKDWGKEEHSSEILTAVADSPQSRIAEARALARRLRELADEGVDPGSMVLLLRAFTHVEAYAEALALAGLDPYVVGGRGYWSSQQVADAICLLTCVANPLDDEALLGALASPACALAPDTLWMLRRASRRHLWPTIGELSRAPDGADGEQADDAPSRDMHTPETPEAPGAVEAPEAVEPPEIDDDEAKRRAEQEAERRLWAERIPEDERERLREFHDRLVALRGRAPLMPLDELVERTLETFGYDLAALQMDDGLQRTANLLKLVRLAAEYDRDEGRDLRGFLRSTAERAALADRDAAAAVAAEDHAGVRIMTIHAAKGLEFDCVAVADLGRQLGALGRSPELQVAGAGGDSPRVGLQLARPGAPSLRLAGYAEIGEQDADREAEESGRLAYVAASRARERLLLSGLLEPGWTAAKQEEKKPEKRRQTTIGRLLARLGVDDLESASLLRPIPAAEARPGLDESYAAPSVAVRVVRMSAETAAELSRDLRRPASPAAIDGGSPPMPALSERGTAAARHLSYAALTAYDRCGYRFLVERVLGLGTGPTAAAPVDDVDDEMGAGREDWDEEPATLEAAAQGQGPADSAADPAEPTAGSVEPSAELAEPSAESSGGGTAVGFGRAVHLLLEEAAADGWDAPTEDRVLAALAGESIGAPSAGAAAAMAAGWLGSDLLAELRASGARFRTEVPFRLHLGEDTVVRGSIDMLATGPDLVPTIVDYKTDRIGPDGPSMSAAYEIQRALYCAAVAEATGAERVRCVHFFLQAPERPQIAELDRDGIAAALERAERLAEAIRGGDFRPTEDPHAALCHDCPARQRLCHHPPELTLRTL